ncbi:UNVERIFIED_CONTAM: hypothetical protein K2H54_013538, partial [Gekko kuhli]
DFLQGLLMKDPRQRLSWPELLYHPFVAGLVTVIDDTAEQGIANPFTSKLPPELQALKEQQTHSLAPHSGQSKILRRARQKMAQEAREKELAKNKTLRKGESTKGSRRGHPHKSRLSQTPTKEGETAASTGEQRQPSLDEKGTEREQKEPSPTPRENWITQDYEKEFLDARPESSKVETQGSRSIATVDLETEELDSDEEWQHLMDATDPVHVQLNAPLSLLGDTTFVQRIHTRLRDSGQQVLEGMLEGTSRLRPALRVIGNLLGTHCDSELLYNFCSDIELPHFLMQLVGSILESFNIKQPWCVTLLTDLIAVMSAYFVSDFNREQGGKKQSFQAFHSSASQFLALLPTLMALPTDQEFRLREQSLMGHRRRQSQRRIGTNAWQQHIQQLSLHPVASQEGMARVIRPKSRSGQATLAFGAAGSYAVPSCLLAEDERNNILVIHSSSALPLSSSCMPVAMSDAVLKETTELFNHVAAASVLSAAGLLLTHLSQYGAAVKLRRDEAFAGIATALTEPAQLCLPPPMDTGFYDGLILLLLQLLSQEDAAVVREFTGSDLWNIVWHRFAMVLRLTNGAPVMESETPRVGQHVPEPEWNLISPQGTLLFLSLVLHIFQREPHQCLLQLAQPNGVIMATLNKLLSVDYLENLAQTQMQDDGDPELVSAVVLQICQLFCFPFALDIHPETLELILTGLRDAEIPAQLLPVCIHYLPFLDTELPLSLLCHFVLTDERLIEQVMRAAASEQAAAFLSAILLSDQVALLVDLLSLLTHVARAGATHLPFLQQFLCGSGTAPQPLGRLLCHRDNSVRARACSLMGNLLRHGQDFVRVLQGQAGLLECLLQRLSDEDEHVRRSASFAVGNAAYHAGLFVQPLSKAVPWVVRLLGDPVAKTRCNAASALGNLGRQSAELGNLLIESRAPDLLLDAACHDSQPAVQEAALIALRSIGQQPRIHEVRALGRGGSQCSL